MRRHGWGGNPPADEVEARARILEAGRRCVDRRGAGEASLSDIATELGVTRQTVYRYFPSTDELFSALAQVAADEFIDRIARRMATVRDPAGAMVEGLAYTIHAIPDEPYLGLLLRSGSADAFTRGIISEVAMDFGHSLLARSHVDWEALGWVGRDLDDLVEVMLRLIQSLVVTPTTPSGQPRDEAALRAWLQRWFAPTLTSAAPTSVS